MAPDFPARDGRIQVLGLCRFSVPSLGAFQTGHATVADARAALYAPDRLRRRFVWFEHVLLPGIRGQTDPDFTLIVLLGRDFPEPWLSRMQSLVADVPQIVLDFVPAQNHRDICAGAMVRQINPDAGLVAEFRLDDDDAVAKGYVAALRAVAGQVRPWLAAHAHVAVDFVKGVVLRADGAEVSAVPNIALFWTPALAVFMRPGSRQHILDWPHNMIWRRIPTLTMIDPPMYVRGSHDGNDSAAPRGSDDWRFPGGDAAGFLSTHFGIDLACFTAAWRAIPDQSEGN